jgi:hypothetical protein
VKRSQRGARTLTPRSAQFGIEYSMTKEQVKEILNRVLTWPPQRQEDAARILTAMEQQDHSDLQLTSEQAAEVRRRLANPSEKRIPAEQVFQRFRSTKP